MGEQVSNNCIWWWLVLLELSRAGHLQ